MERVLSKFSLLARLVLGKTAILEGLASRIVSKEVPEVRQLRRYSIFPCLTLYSPFNTNASYLSILQLYGRFRVFADSLEEKFKALIRDIEDEGGNVICFIDEVRKWPYSHCISSSI